MAINYIRLKEILKVINAEGKVTIERLLEIFPDISSMTLRRDLINLENRGEIIRVHGGAISTNEINSATSNFVSRSKLNLDKKKEIAEKAQKYIDIGHSIYLDNGTTTLAVAKMLSDLNYNLVTHGIRIAEELSMRSMPSVVLLGGNVAKSNLTTNGSFAISMLQQINLDIAIMSATAYSIDNGFSCGSIYESEIKKFVIKKARKRIMLLDSTKIDNIMPYTFALASEVDVLISDHEFPADLVKLFKKVE